MVFFIRGVRALWASRKADRNNTGSSTEDLGPKANTRVDGPVPAAGAPLPKSSARTYAREAAALVLIASGLYCALALASYEADPLRPAVAGENWVGPVGEVFARATVSLVGAVGWLIPLELSLVARPLLIDKRVTLSITRLSGDVVVAVILAALVHIAVPDVRSFGNMPLGGVVGDLFGEVSRGLFSTIGSFLIGLTVVALILVERATFSFIEAAQRLRGWFERLQARAGKGVDVVGKAWVDARAADAERRETERFAAEPVIASPEHADAIIAAFADDGEGYVPRFLRRKQPPPRADNATRREALRPEAPGHDPASLAPEEPDDEAVTPSPIMPSTVVDALTRATPTPVTPSPSLEKKASPSREKKAPPPVDDAAANDSDPKIVDTSKAAKTKKARRRKRGESRFELPTSNLLDPLISNGAAHSPDKLKEMARLLEKTLLDYRVEGKVQEIHPGPTVTMFEVSPAPGTKVSKVASLADDLALGLSRKVRIIAPIVGKNRIGFEVPNDQRFPVNLRELVESQDFMNLDVPLPCVLGRDIIGRPYFADLASMPHVIVAGATGAGKSVGLNVMLVSLLYRRTPDELRVLMIDPKVVELAPFDHIPHLLFPVVTDMKQASNSLKWAVDEMERRYQLFADAGVRNIVTYNKYISKVLAGDIKLPASLAHGLPPGQDVSDVEPKKLPYIAIVIEEFADLIMTQGKDVEASVARLAQKARAAGVYVILATQRPSVDVITGVIKANFPTRIAYRVAQKVDSRTILDQQGAEHLLGRGDMLVKLNGTNDVCRVQCPFVSEDEVQRVTDMLRSQGAPEYDENIVRGRDDDEDKKGKSSAAESDALYDEAVRIVADTRKCSTSWIQRKLGVGYNRAAKIVEAMEAQGIVGPPNGSKPREILILPQ